MGTVQYFSPEQAQGKPVDRTTDIYSLGIILFEILTGKLPFEGDNLVAIALKQVQEDPPAPSTINPSVTPYMDKVVLKALSKNPGDRYQDMDEFMQEVENAFTRPESKPELIQPQEIGSTPVLQAGHQFETIEITDEDEEEYGMICYDLVKTNTTLAKLKGKPYFDLNFGTKKKKKKRKDDDIILPEKIQIYSKMQDDNILITGAVMFNNSDDPEDITVLEETSELG